jgi:hypothetical protein
MNMRNSKSSDGPRNTPMRISQVAALGAFGCLTLRAHLRMVDDE